METIGLSVGYIINGKKLTLLEDLNVQLHAGELVCLMGPNGIGKSTLLRTLAGLQKPLQGKICGVTEKNIALVLTDRIVATNMTVYDLVTYGRYPYLDWSISLSAEDKKIIDESIEQVHIQHLRDKRLYELSDGQMQMAMIARALGQQTPILLLDEPTAHLDLNNRVEIMNLLRSLSRIAGKAILVCTHELDLALQTADRIWLTTTEKKIKSGIPEDLVLDGSFDDVFQFKGFDLKTGKVEQYAHRKVSLNVTGTGYPLLWTKNALERCGYQIDDNASTIIFIDQTDKIIWKFNERFFESLSALLIELSGKG
ncbi:MAG: ABC transporter ATP-binding protein [Cyclobacteriaceae bacterium]